MLHGSRNKNETGKTHSNKTKIGRLLKGISVKKIKSQKMQTIKSQLSLSEFFTLFELFFGDLFPFVT